MPYLRLLALTLACELPILAAAARWRRQPVGWVLAVALAANLTTHGLFFLTFPEVPGDLGVKLTLFELAVTGVEAAAYATLGRLGWGPALAAALGANALSLAVGLATT